MSRHSQHGDSSLPPAWLSAVRLVHPFPSVVVAAVTVGFTVLVDPFPGIQTAAYLGIGMLCYQLAIGIVNDVVDADADRQTKPWKAVARGVVSGRAAAILACILAASGLLLTMYFGVIAWLLGVAGLACGLLYDVRLKRTRLSWLPFAVAFPLIPLWVFVASHAWSPLLWWTLPLGASLGFALHLANQAPDISGEAEIDGAAHRMGEQRARLLAILAFGATTIAAAGALAGAGETWRGVTTLAAGLLAATVAPLLARRVRDGLFGALALGAAVVAVVFVSAA